MKFLTHLLLALLIIPAIAFSQEDARLDLEGTPMLISLSTNPLVVGTAGVGALKLLANNAVQLSLSDGAITPEANSDLDLGTAVLSFEDIFAEKALLDNDSAAALDADVTTATTAAPLLAIVGTSLTQAHAALVQNVASAQGADLFALKTRAAAGSTNANTIISSGDDILKIRAFGSNGTAYDEAAQILLESGGTPGASADMPGAIKFLTSGDGSATPTLRTTIEPDGDFLMTGDIYWADGDGPGFTIADGANAACDTTCTTGCVIGFDAGTTAFVACATATADTCVCTK